MEFDPPDSAFLRLATLQLRLKAPRVNFFCPAGFCMLLFFVFTPSVMSGLNGSACASYK